MTRMTLREHQSNREKYVNFTNGFPRKEMVPTEGPSSRPNLRGGYFIGLHDGATACMTKSQKIVPPLAKRRAVALPRASSSRYKNKKDPFSAHKGTEKLGFSPQAIKHRKPKIERNSPRNESTNSASIDLVKLTRLPAGRQAEHLISSTAESDTVAKATESLNKNVILSDVEKQKTLTELIGIDEVYQRVCNGNMNSLSSLVAPVKSKKKLKQVQNGSSSTQYIQTSAPLHLRQSKKRHSVLVPLPFFPNPKPPNTAPARLKETYAHPRVYTSRQDNRQRPGVVSSLSGWSSPSIINFNPVVDLPDINKRPVSRVCQPTGSIIGVQNKAQTGTVAIVAALDTTLTPPATAESEAILDGFIEDDNKNGELNKSPDEDSLYSEGEVATSTKHDPTNVHVNHDINEQSQKAHSSEPNPGDHDLSNKNTEKISDDTLTASFSFTLNVTDESGHINDVEIYDPNSRDLEKEEKVNKDIEEAQKNYQKKKHELESLLDEHNNLVQEVNQISNELQD